MSKTNPSPTFPMFPGMRLLSRPVTRQLSLPRSSTLVAAARFV